MALGSTKAQLEAAMSEFDRTMRDTDEWKDWTDNKSHRYAIQHNDKLYPVKQVVSLATGVSVSQFSGGEGGGQANAIVAPYVTVVPLRATSPDWTRDELILALDLYLKHRANPPAKDSAEIMALSQTLNLLGGVLFGSTNSNSRYRNNNGVYMKLMNFRRLDPLYTQIGKTGLAHGGKTEEVVWKEFSNDPVRCAQVADAIRATLDGHEPSSVSIVLHDEDEFAEAPEGRLLTRVHLSRERKHKLIDKKKSKVMKATGRLACEVCGFEFAAKYGDRGAGFIECHHTKPVATLTPDSKTHIDDLALVCSNCHRMIHRARPWFELEQLRKVLRS